MSYVDKKDIVIDRTPNLSARTYATIIIQIKLANKFNNF